MKKTVFIVLLSLLSTLAQAKNIHNFTIKESLSKNDKLAIIAIDSLDQTDEGVNGTYIFSLNGFKQELKFHDGIAVSHLPIESSTFIFFKHKNQENNKGRLFYIYKGEKDLKPFAISGLAFVIIPGIVLLFAYLFKRVLLSIILMIIGFSFFNYSKGLSLGNIVESILHSIKNFLF